MRELKKIFVSAIVLKRFTIPFDEMSDYMKTGIVKCKYENSEGRIIEGNFNYLKLIPCG